MVFALLLESGREYHIGSSCSDSFPFSFDAMPCAWVVDQRANICTRCVPLPVRRLGVGTMAEDTIHHGGSQKKNQQSPWTGSYRYIECSLPPPPPPPTSTSTTTRPYKNINNDKKSTPPQNRPVYNPGHAPKIKLLRIAIPVCRHTGYYGCISPITGCCFTGTSTKKVTCVFIDVKARRAHFCLNSESNRRKYYSRLIGLSTIYRSSLFSFGLLLMEIPKAWVFDQNVIGFQRVRKNDCQCKDAVITS
jgi:hypothetical protein